MAGPPKGHFISLPCGAIFPTGRMAGRPSVLESYQTGNSANDGLGEAPMALCLGRAGIHVCATLPSRRRRRGIMKTRKPGRIAKGSRQQGRRYHDHRVRTRSSVGPLAFAPTGLALDVSKAIGCLECLYSSLGHTCETRPRRLHRTRPDRRTLLSMLLQCARGLPLHRQSPRVVTRADSETRGGREPVGGAGGNMAADLLRAVGRWLALVLPHSHQHDRSPGRHPFIWLGC